MSCPIGPYTGTYAAFTSEQPTDRAIAHASRGVPSHLTDLSLLFAAFHLVVIDQTFCACPHLVYVRYMDDCLLFAKTRWHLRRAVKQLNQFLVSYEFKPHPDKTFIGKVDKSFDWMGCLFNADGCAAVTPRALANHAIKLRRLCEQARRGSLAKDLRRVEEYRKWWTGWAISGSRIGWLTHPVRLRRWLRLAPTPNSVAASLVCHLQESYRR
ncbi:reverse transcriptase domain-containing protein [Mycetohabitans sp. B46]|uniref:reverse transcriptase domain-containing protein n=1 Tax=Mycetohabitans sp. B46 TaxID=2772536 RepID=UPI00307E4292